MPDKPINEHDIQGYVDQQLSSERLRQVEEYLRHNAEAAARVAAYRQQNNLLRRHFEPLMDAPIPSHLLAAISPEKRSKVGLFPRSIWQFAAGVLLIVLSGATGWFLRGVTSPSVHSSVSVVSSQLARQAAFAHVLYSPTMQRPKEIDPEEEDRLIQWLSQRMEIQVRPPKMRSSGYQLIGARLLPGAAGPIVQFMYHNGEGARVTLYACVEEEQRIGSQPRFAEEGLVNVFYWFDGGFAYAISSGIEKEKLQDFTQVAYEQMHGQKTKD